jgi:hypothetical protein
VGSEMCIRDSQEGVQLMKDWINSLPNNCH